MSFGLRDEVARLLKLVPTLRKLGERFERCHRDAIVFPCTQCGESYAVPYRCNLAICEYCSGYRARQIYKRYLARIKRRRDLKHVTLTWGSVEN